MNADVRGLRAKAGVLDDISIDWYDLQKVLDQIENPKKVKIATGCPLCNNIWSSAEQYKKFSNDSDAYYKTVIVVWDDKPWLYTMCDDWHLMQIDFCPKCGRKLMEE